MDQEGSCPICNRHAEIDLNDKKLLASNCAICGKFKITIDAMEMYYSSSTFSKKLSLLQWISDNGDSLITEDMMTKIIEPLPMPSILDVLDSICLWLGKELKELNATTTISPDDLISIAKVHSKDELYYVLDELAEIRFIDFQISELFHKVETIEIGLKFEGWINFEKLTKI